MIRNLVSLSSFFIFSAAYASYLLKPNLKVDKSNQIQGVELSSAKVNDSRIYQSLKSETITGNLEVVKKAILDFNQRCNNELKERRKYTSKNQVCPYHNDNVIEVTLLPLFDLKNGAQENYLQSLYIYNRQDLVHHQLVSVFYPWKGDSKKMRILLELIDDKKAQKIAGKIDPTQSVFQNAVTEFILHESKPKQVKVQYSYEIKTDHWLLNKSIAAENVFENMQKGINTLFSELQKQVSSYEEAKANPSQAHQ